MFYLNEIEMYRILLSFSIGAIAVSAWSLLNMYIPDHPIYNRIRKSRKLISIDYIAIVAFNVWDLICLPIGGIIPILFFTIGMYQTVFLGYAFASLISPIEINWKKISLQTVGITSLFFINVYCNEIHPSLVPYLLCFSLILYFTHLTYYSIKFFRIYRNTLNRIKDYLAEEEETRMAWVKNNFIALIILSILASCSIINQDWFYYSFIISYVVIYSYIANTFIKRNHKYTKVLPTVVNIANKEQEMEQDRLFKEQSMKDKEGNNHYNNFSRIALILDHWVSNQGFLKPNVTIDQILAMLDTTRPTLRAFMQKIYGMTFSEWRNELRLDYAYDLLREHPEHTVETISKMVGFDDELNFGKAFRKKFLMSPKEARCLKEEDL